MTTPRFFVSADTGNSYGMLLGLYPTKAAAEARVSLGNTLKQTAWTTAINYARPN